MSNAKIYYIVLLACIIIVEYILIIGEMQLRNSGFIHMARETYYVLAIYKQTSGP